MPKPAARVTDLTQHGGIIMPPCALKTMIEMLPAARLTDMHTCPMVTVLVPHVGGPIIMAAPTVFIEFLPAARVMDQLVCVGPPDMIQMGAMKTFIGEGGGGGGAVMGTISPPSAPSVPGAPSQPNAHAMPGVPALSPGPPPDGGPGAPAAKATTEGDPIDVATGRVFTSVDDFTTQGKPGITFNRFYSTSQAMEPGVFGYGWTHNLDHRLTLGKEFITYQDAQGRRVLFLPLAPDQEFIRHLDENITLRRIQNRYRIELPNGQRLHFLESAPGSVARLEQIDDAAGGTCRLHYQNGLPYRLIDAIGNEYLFDSYNGKHIQGITFRSHDQTSQLSIARFSYDVAGNLTHCIDALGYTLHYQYGPDHRLLLREDKCGHAFQFEYDHKGRCIRASGPNRLFEQTFYYHESAPQTAVRDARGKTTTYFFNALRMVTRVSNAQGGENKYEYQGMNLVRRTDSLGRAVEFVYDTHGGLLMTKKPGGAQETHQAFSDGSSQSVDAEGHSLTMRRMEEQTRLYWDGDEAPLVVAAPGPGLNRVTVQDTHGNSTILTFDRADRVVGLRRPLGQEFRFVYDARGQRVAVTDPTGAGVQFARDNLGRLTTLTRDGGSSFQFDYDGNGSLSHFVDGNGQTSHFVCQQFERLTQFTDPTGSVCRYEYDDFNRLRKAINGRGNATVFDYDALGRIQRVLYPDGRSEYYTFDPAGQLRRLLDRGGMSVDCDYDADGELTLLRYANGTALAFARDKNGHILAANTADCETTFVYDKLGRLIEESQNGATTVYEYDASGLLMALMLPSGERIIYGYDANGRLETMEGGSGRVHAFTYAESGPLLEHRFPNGLLSMVELSRLGLPVNITLQRSGSARPLARTSYRYDGNDAVTEINDTQLGQIAYLYDRAGRVTGARYGSATGEAFRYDAAGNLLSRAAPNATPLASDTLVYNAADQFDGGGGTRCRHDARGQIIEIKEERAQGTRALQFLYDGQGLLTSVTLPDNTKVEYAYDAFMRRISKKRGDTETYFAWAGHQLVSEIICGPQNQETHLTYYYRPGTHILIAALIDDLYYCIHSDHRGAPVRITNPEGEIVWLADYSAWGAARLRVQEIEFNLRLPGQYYDAETGLHYNRARYYHPEWGRYVTPDPAGYAGGANLYVYANNDPINRTDPLGMWPDTGGAHQSVGSAVGGAVRTMINGHGNRFSPPQTATAAATPTVTTTTPAQNSIANTVAPSPGAASQPPPPSGTAQCGMPSDAGKVEAAAATAIAGAAAGAQPGGTPTMAPPTPAFSQRGREITPDTPAPTSVVPRLPTQQAGTPSTPTSTTSSTKKYRLWDLRWEPAEGVCGDKINVVGSTDAPDGTSINFSLKAQQGSSPNLSGFTAQVNGGKVSQTWEIKDVSFKSGSAFLESVSVAAQSTDANLPSNAAVLKVKAQLDTGEETFSADRAWGAISRHSEFKQKIEKFSSKITVSIKIMKGWGGAWVDLSSAGVTGKAGGCPWDGMRWARSVTTGRTPNQYHDGKDWRSLPSGFHVTAANSGSTGFYKDGTTWRSLEGGTWPEAFADYDFDKAAYARRRAEWMTNTHDTWTDVFHLRRKGCQSQAGTRCCLYEVDVTLAFSVVNTYASDVILVCTGGIRASAGLWAYDDARIKAAANKTGQQMGNPDEFKGGAVDVSIADDGAVGGVDADSIMGQNLTGVKKRHYRSFAEMTQRLIKSTYGKDYAYEVVEK